MFDDPARALDKEVAFEGKRFKVIGVVKKQGQSFVGGFDYDHCLIITYRAYAGIYDVNREWSQPFIMVNGREDVSTKALIDELEGLCGRHAD